MVVVALVLVLAVPALLMWLEQKIKVVEIIGPVLICYGLGLLLGNIGFTWPKEFLEKDVSSAAVPLAIPLLMFQSNPRKWLLIAKGALKAYGAAILAVYISVFIAYLIFGIDLLEGPKIAAMLVGVYSGGTPNLVAIGKALEVSNEVTPSLIMLDTVLCAFYLLFLLSAAEKILGFVLKKSVIIPLTENSDRSSLKTKWPRTGIALLLSVLCLGSAIGVSYLFHQKIESVTVLLSLTVLAFLLSLSKKVNLLPNSYRLGEYFILVFCLAIGLLSDFSVLKSQDSNLIFFCITVVYGSILLHILLSKIFGLDVHNVMITSTAALFGPAFVGMIATRLKNPGLVTSGMTTGVIGYVIANFLGLVMYKLIVFIF